MVIVPDSKIILIKNPLKLDSNNEIMFANAQVQENYFKSLPKLEYNAMTYVRKDGVIRVDTDKEQHPNAPTFEDLLKYNFCMYQNTHFDNKWFYAYITEVNWINPGTTEIKIETAYFQTWQFDLQYMQSFIEREHVDNDTIGLHTIDEGLETGEYIAQSTQNLFNASDTYICVGVSEVVDGITLNPYVSEYNGVYSGLKYFLCEDAFATSKLIRIYDNLGKGDSIVVIFLIPKSLVGSVTFSVETIGNISTNMAIIPYSQNAQLLSTTTNITNPTAFGNFTPQNRKLYTFPYNYMYVTNNIGNDVVYHYEDFINNTAQFKVYGAITPSCSIKCIPINYKKLSDTQSSLNSFNYGIMSAKLPMCSWSSDPYTNWLTQNGVNIMGTTLNQQEANTLMGVGSMIAGGLMLASGVGSVAVAGGLLVGGATGIFNTMQTNYRKDIIPQQSKGSINGGDIQYSAGCSTIQLFKMQIREEMARCIDGYFQMFGYKVNRLGFPHLHVRQYFDYIKTIDVNIEGNIPEHDLNEIRKMFNNGIRFWHTTENYLNFNVNNAII